MAEEGMKHTDNKLIHIGKPIPFDINTFLGQLEELAEDFRTSVIGTVSHSEQVPLSEEQKKTLMECYPDSAMAGEYRTLAKQMYAICREDV